MSDLITQSSPIGSPPDERITLAANLDRKIAIAKQKVASLEAAKERLAASGMLTARIDDLRAATRTDDDNF